MISNYINRYITRPNDSFFLMGVRGTGKSSWVKKEFENSYTINLLDESVYQSYLYDVYKFSSELNTRKPGDWVFIDEIQRLPNLLNEVHKFIEDKKLKFILTGSSARKLKRHGVNLLAGRAIKKIMYPFIYSELENSFDLMEILKFGSLPIIWTAENKIEKLEAYVQMYLKEEVQAEALVRNLPGFARFIPIAALFNGQTLNISSLARDAGVARTTINGYIEILEDTLLVFKLHPYEGKLRVKEKSHPKLYWIDQGLVRAAKKELRTELYPVDAGHLFESFIATNLKMHGEYNNLFDDLYYWSTGSSKNTEVDFLLKRQNEFIAVEVKYTDTIKKEHFAGLNAIKELKGITRRIIVYKGEKILKTDDGIEILPVKDFFNAIYTSKLWL